ncbi:hypothetical protein N7445_002462 [Penicillium cf. griseofulvum]|nr:hypothetical protein N7445_002462 [Penicillium cf. griseofulvum]
MDLSQLPDITGLLVRPDNPPRNDVEGMDYPRCAALYNYLAQYSWLAEGRPLATLNEYSANFFTAFGAEAEALRPRLHPSLVAFLDTAMIPPSDSPDQFPPPLSIFAWGLPTPDGLIEEFVADLQDQPVDSLVRLSPVGLSGEGSGGGVIYHQRFHRVAVFMHLDYYDYGFPVEDHPDIWNPLETVLSHWINLIQLGKVVASPHEEPALFDFEKIGPWEWRPYSEAQVITCVSAWDRLCRAIEARISQLPNPLSLIGPISGIDADNPEPLVASTVLDAASVPDPSFARSFLTRARRPRFHYIAPGLLLPPADSSEFVAAQPFAVLPHSQHTAPPVCLFPAEGETSVLFSSREQQLHFYCLYTAAVERNGLDTAEDGFRLLLPFTLNDGWGRSVGARRSDGELADRGSFADLFQHGFKPFGGSYYRPQRLERLLDCWRKLVEEGVWSVGPKGVEGTIDTFKDAESDRWEDYYIPPTW